MSDHAIVILDRQQRLLPSAAIPLLNRCGVSRADAARAVRRQRGILFSRIPMELAERIAEALTIAGMDALAMPESDFPPLPRPVRVSSSIARIEGLEIPSLASLGLGGLVPWESISFAAASLVLAETEHSLMEYESFLQNGGTTHEDHVDLAMTSFDRLATRRFPLRHYLEADPAEFVNFSRVDKTGAKKAEKKKRNKRIRTYEPHKELERFTGPHPGLTGWLTVWDGARLLKLAAHEAMFERRGEETAGHWIRPFCGLLSDIGEQARNAHLTPDFMALADGSDDAPYVHEDVKVIDDHARWWIGHGQHAAKAEAAR